MAKLYHKAKCNNRIFIATGKDSHGHQKYRCKKCWYQWVANEEHKVLFEAKGRATAA